MKYLVLQAVSIKGSRVEKGSIVDIEESLAKGIGSDVLEALDVPPVVEKKQETVKEEIDFDSLKKDELVEIAKSKGLSTKGSKSDLLERIKLSVN